jgi:hypothetical protein
VFTARYALSPYIKQIRFVFKGLITQWATQAQHIQEKTAAAATAKSGQKKNIRNNELQLIQLKVITKSKDKMPHLVAITITRA